MATHTHAPCLKGGGASATVAPYLQHSMSLVCHTAVVWTTRAHAHFFFFSEGMSRTLFALSQPSLLKHDAVPVTKPLSLAGANMNLIHDPNELIKTQVIFLAFQSALPL